MNQARLAGRGWMDFGRFIHPRIVLALLALVTVACASASAAPPAQPQAMPAAAPADYCIGRWQWVTGDLDVGHDYWGSPNPSQLLGALDLRSLPQQAKPGGAPEGYGLFAYSAVQAGPQLYCLHSLAGAVSVTEPVWGCGDDPCGYRTYNAPYLSTLLLSTESWQGYFQVDGLYLLSVTATAERHSELANKAPVLGRTLGELHSTLRSQLAAGYIRSEVQREYNRLKRLNCTLPDDPVEIVGNGNIHCP